MKDLLSHESTKNIIDLNSGDNLLKTPPIHLAAQYGQPEIMKDLMEAREKRIGGEGTDETKSLLRRSTVKMHEQIQGKTPLHFAAKNGNLECVKLLVNNYLTLIDVQEADSTAGRTALHYAIEYDRFAIVKILVENEADVTLTIKKGKRMLSVLDLAVENTQIHDYLSSYLRTNAERLGNWKKKEVDEKSVISDSVSSSNSETPLNESLPNESSLSESTSSLKCSLSSKIVSKALQKFQYDSDTKASLVQIGLDYVTQGLSNSEDNTKPFVLPSYVTGANESKSGYFIGILWTDDLEFVLVNVENSLITGQPINQAYPIDQDIKMSNSDILFEYLTDCLSHFLDNADSDRIHIDKKNKVYIGLVFGFPTRVKSPKHMYLTKWIRDYDVSGVVNKNVFELFENSIKKRPGMTEKVKLIGFWNDNAGTMACGLASDRNVRLAFIADLGSNAGYFEKMDNIKTLSQEYIKKLKNMETSSQVNTRSSEMIIITEWGNIGNDRAIENFKNGRLLTDYDRETLRVYDSNLDGAVKEGLLMGARYLAETVRQILCDFTERGCLNEKYFNSKLFKHKGVDGNFLYGFDLDGNRKFSEEDIEVLARKLEVEQVSSEEISIIYKTVVSIVKRGAVFMACNLAAFCLKTMDNDGSQDYDGSLDDLQEVICAYTGGLVVNLNGYKEFVENEANIILKKHGFKLRLIKPSHDVAVGAALLASFE